VPVSLPFRFPVIIGPTAGGKSTLAVEVARVMHARHSIVCEIVTADAIQIYRGLDIGSAKPTVSERSGIPHHLIDVAEPTERFSVDEWLKLAQTAITDIKSRGHLPIVVGGTHLYIKAFLEGLFDGPAVNDAIRIELAALDPAARRAELERVDPVAASRIHPNDQRRTIRALEVYRATGKPISEHQSQWDSGNTRSDCVLFGLDWEIPALNQRINLRVKHMIEAGLVQEVRALHESRKFGPQAREGLGYKQILAHFDARCTLEEAIERIKIETRRFGKNQRTWLRRLRTIPGSHWISMPSTSLETSIQLVVEQVLTSSVRAS